jgi:outer membrane receptor protein involved in Fe transport
MSLRFGVAVLSLGLMLPAGAMAQDQSTSPPQGETPPAVSTESPTPPATNEQPAAGESGQSQPAPTADQQGGQLPPVQVVQPKPKPVVKKAAAPVKPRVVKRPPPPPPPAAPAVPPTPPAIDAESSGSVMSLDTQVPMSPVQGATIPLEKVPAGVSIVKGSDIARQFYVDTPAEVLQQRVPGIILDDVQGNVFQNNIQFRGFESSPVNGEAQGLAVYQNGVRINESFGDIVNYDFLPGVAINTMNVVTNNPVYGLNALAGAIVIDMKNGFNYHGAEVTGTGGSFGRAQGTAQVGVQAGNWGMYFGGERITDDGYRDFSESQIKRMFADLGFRNSTADLHFTVTGANNTVGVTAAAPVQLLGLDWQRTFTSPQTTLNKMIMPAFNGTVNVAPNTSISGVAYYRNFKQSHIDGNITEAEPCEDDPTLLCFEGDPVFFNPTDTVIPIDVIPDGKSVGSIDKTGEVANSWGGSLQAVNKAPLFGHTNQFLVGASYDHGDVHYQTSSELGYFRPYFFVQGLGITMGCQPPGPDCEPDDVAPRDLTTENEYIGVYFSDTFNITDRLAATVGGRYNHAEIITKDLTGNLPGLDATNVYERFNPAAGLTYQLSPTLSLYGGYSEANRAPVAAELSCSDPEAPCLIESFLASDPPLDQVVAKTWETGVRGSKVEAASATRLDWSLGLFRTETINDILPVVSQTSGRGVFANAGDTLRQGVEANLSYKTPRWFFYTNYAFIDATFESNIILPSPNNPRATPCPIKGGGEDEDEDDEEEALCVFVTPGDTMPGIPQHRFKAGIDYWITQKWKFGGDLIAVSGQYFFGDESNLNPQLSGYTRVDLHTSYDVTPRVQIYGLANNIFDQHYGIFGTFFDRELGNRGAAGDPQLGDDFFTNPRTITPAPPTVVYGGMKVKLW